MLRHQPRELGGTPIDLTLTEFKILALPVLRTGKDNSYRETYALVQGKNLAAGYGDDGYHASVRTFIQGLRKKPHDVGSALDHIDNCAVFGCRWCPD